MKKKPTENLDDDLRPEYDLSKLKGGVQGKYVRRMREGSNVVLLAPDVAPYFPNEQAVNSALRALIDIAKKHVHQSR